MSMDDISEVEITEQAPRKKKVTIRDEIERIRGTMGSPLTEIEEEDESESDDETPCAVKGKAPPPRGKDKSTSNHGT